MVDGEGSLPNTSAVDLRARALAGEHDAYKAVTALLKTSRTAREAAAFHLIAECDRVAKLMEQFGSLGYDTSRDELMEVAQVYAKLVVVLGCAPKEREATSADVPQPEYDADGWCEVGREYLAAVPDGLIAARWQHKTGAVVALCEGRYRYRRSLSADFDGDTDSLSFSKYLARTPRWYANEKDIHNAKDARPVCPCLVCESGRDADRSCGRERADGALP